jgi:hypothetical protein
MEIDMRLMMLASSLALTLAVGCDPITSDPDLDDRDDDIDVGTEGGEPPPALHAYAIRFGDLPEVDLGDSAGSGGDDGGGSEIDPDALLVVISTGADGCDDPWAAHACGQWRATFTLPADAVPGDYALFPDLNGGHSVSGPADDTGECWWGGGSLNGSLSIQSIDDDAIIGSLAATDAFDFDPTGPFTAVLCR